MVNAGILIPVAPRFRTALRKPLSASPQSRHDFVLILRLVVEVRSIAFGWGSFSESLTSPKRPAGSDGPVAASSWDSGWMVGVNPKNHVNDVARRDALPEAIRLGAVNL